jgi:hypothetical protein
MLRIISLVVLLATMVAITLKMLALAPYQGMIQPFFSIWLVLFVPYLLACLVLPLTNPALGRWRWLELGLILFGALLLRAMLVPLSPHPGLSRDSWRYLWDARVTLLGYSPYVSPPNSPQFLALRDFLYENSRFRDVPTIYPPAAQAVYLLSYLISPSNIYFLKGIFVCCDLCSCIFVILLLKRRGLDPARVLLYAWCPLPIVEFALQGHLDALTVVFSLLTVLATLDMRRGGRLWTGFWLAVTTLTKLYPLLYLAAVWRWRERLLPLVCLLVIVLSYVPYLILGHGHILGFFSTYIDEQGTNAGPLRVVLIWLNDQLHLSRLLQTVWQQSVVVGTLGGAALIIWLLRQKNRISVEAALLLLTGVIFLVSPHIFPWYTAALLPWVAILVRPLWSRRTGLNAAGLIVAASWYLSCLSIMGYTAEAFHNWSSYYWLVYGPICLALMLAAGQLLATHGWLHLPSWLHPRDEEHRPAPALDEKNLVIEAEQTLPQETNHVHKVDGHEKGGQSSINATSQNKY